MLDVSIEAGSCSAIAARIFLFRTGIGPRTYIWNIFIFSRIKQIAKKRQENKGRTLYLEYFLQKNIGPEEVPRT